MTTFWRRETLAWTLAALLAALAAGLALRVLLPPGPPELEEVAPPPLLWPPAPDAQ